MLSCHHSQESDPERLSSRRTSAARGRTSAAALRTVFLICASMAAGVFRGAPASRAQGGPGKVDVTTYHYDNARSGLNSQETVLKPSNVNSASFGQLFSHLIDGFAYAAPLIVTNVTITGHGVQNGVHDVAFVATEHGSVYAFDANDADGANVDPLWSARLVPGGATTVPTADVNSEDLVPEICITSTPVIDAATRTIYVLAKTKEGAAYVQRLHALDLGTGEEKFGGPAAIVASVPGTGDGSVIGQNGNRVVPFHPLREHNRPALLLQNGTVYIAWASHGDNGPYHGWVLAYNASTLAPTAAFNTTPNGGLGGIWMGGAGLASDGASIFFETGNGTFDANSGGRDYGDSFIRLRASDLSVADYFTPFNQAALDQADEDLGSGGVLLLPDSVGSASHPRLLVGAGKEGKIYLLDRAGLGGFQAASDSQIVQSLPGAVGGAFCMPAYFNSTIYYNGIGDRLKAFPISNGHISPMSSQSSFTLQFPGATPVVSSNGLADGIVWLLQTDGYSGGAPAVLRAFDATNVAIELYDSSQVGARDAPGGAVKFTVPTVANGKVYVAAQNSLCVYGTAAWAATPVIRPNGGQFTRSALIVISDATPGARIYYTVDGSDPTTRSALYIGQFTLSNSANVRARAYKAGLARSAPAQAFFGIGPAGSGDGLAATYFDTAALSGSTVQRIDPTVNFNWNGASPAPGIPGTNWSARWTGFVQPQTSGKVTFSTLTDDGVRLWVNDQLIIDNWTNHAPTMDSGAISLFAHALYPIRMEFFQGAGGSVAQLSWSVLGAGPLPIPQSQLYSGIVPGPQILPSGGPFRANVLVDIVQGATGGTVYYTLDGSTPTVASRRFTGPFSLSSTTTVKAKTITSAGAQSGAVSATFTKTTTAAVIAINSGGSFAVPFAADAYFDSGGTNSVTNAIDTHLVTGPAPQAVYQSERWGGAFAYRFTGLKPAASYKVRLHFTEIAWTSVGQRVFNVAINGAPVLTNFDIIGATGAAFTAAVREFSRNAAPDGTVSVQFSSVVDYASCSGIEIIPNSSTRGRDD